MCNEKLMKDTGKVKAKARIKLRGAQTILLRKGAVSPLRSLHPRKDIRLNLFSTDDIN